MKLVEKIASRLAQEIKAIYVMINALAAPGGLPTGTVIHSLATTVTGYVLLNGAVIDKNTYSNLWLWVQSNPLWLGTNVWQFRDIDANSFSLPDFRGLFLRNAGTNSSITKGNGSPFGNSLGTKQNDQLLIHGHDTNIEIFGDADSGGAGSGTRNGRGGDAVVVGPRNIGYGNRFGDETNPVNISVNMFIKY